MDSLANRLPPSQLRRFISEQLKPGAILCLHYDFPDKSREKFFILCCVQPKCLMLTINSHICKLAYFKGWDSEFVMIAESAYAFLEHDSYIDCHQVHTGLDKITIVTQLLADPTRVKDRLLPGDINLVLSMIEKSRTIIQIEKDMIKGALQSN